MVDIILCFFAVLCSMRHQPELAGAAPGHNLKQNQNLYRTRPRAEQE